MNFLLIQLKRIGDSILTLPAVAALRKEFSDAHITLVIAHDSSALAPAIAGVDRISVIQRTAGDAAVFWAIWRGRFDYAIDFTQNDRSALLTWLSRANQRIAPARVRRQGFRRLVYNRLVENSVRDMHTIDYNFSLLQPLGIAAPPPPLSIDVPARATESAARLLDANGLTKPLIVFHPTSARIEKFWEAARWAKVIEQVRAAHGLSVMLSGGSRAMEQHQISAIKAALREPITDLSGKTDLMTLIGLISRARLLVTVDSAPMHIAAALRVPQVVLFGPTNPFHWRPRESPTLILHGESPEPVRQFTPEAARKPMNLISTDAVINGINALLSTPTAGA